MNLALRDEPEGLRHHVNGAPGYRLPSGGLFTAYVYHAGVALLVQVGKSSFALRRQSYLLVGQGIGLLVAGVPRVAAHPLPGDPVLLDRRVQSSPQGLVGLALPALGHGVDHVLGCR